MFCLLSYFKYTFIHGFHANKSWGNLGLLLRYEKIWLFQTGDYKM